MDDQATESAERRAPKIFLFLTASLIPGIFALIAALAWNSLFVEIFNRLSRGRNFESPRAPVRGGCYFEPRIAPFARNVPPRMRQGQFCPRRSGGQRRRFSGLGLRSMEIDSYVRIFEELGVECDRF